MSQGLVHGNTVISHFGNVDRKCTFCKIIKVGEAKTRLGRELTPAEYDNEIITVPDEDRPHIFWSCPTVFDTISYVMSKLWGQNVLDKKSFLMGRIAQNMELTLIYQLVNMYIRFKIWNYKLAGILQRKSMIVHETENLLYSYRKKAGLERPAVVIAAAGHCPGLN
jgi:hypothetical protein